MTAEAPSAGDNADASLEAQSLEVNTGSLNFSDIEENYTQANETLSVIRNKYRGWNCHFKDTEIRLF